MCTFLLQSMIVMTNNLKILKYTKCYSRQKWLLSEMLWYNVKYFYSMKNINEILLYGGGALSSILPTSENILKNCLCFNVSRKCPKLSAYQCLQ